MTNASEAPRGRAKRFRLLFTTLALTLSAGCVSRPINVEARLIRCSDFIPEELKTGEEASRAPEPGNTSGDWVSFGQQTEAARIGENRDKLIVVGITQRCDDVNARVNARPRRRFLGIF